MRQMGFGGTKGQQHCKPKQAQRKDTFHRLKIGYRNNRMKEQMNILIYNYLETK